MKDEKVRPIRRRTPRQDKLASIGSALNRLTKLESEAVDAADECPGRRVKPSLKRVLRALDAWREGLEEERASLVGQQQDIADAKPLHVPGVQVVDHGAWVEVVDDSFYTSCELMALILVGVGRPLSTEILQRSLEKRPGKRIIQPSRAMMSERKRRLFSRVGWRKNTFWYCGESVGVGKLLRRIRAL